MKKDKAKTYGPGHSQTFDAIPEDEERQEELNRIMRKPGEPLYSPRTERTERDMSEPDDAGAEG